MTKPLKVFGGCFDGSHRWVVAAKSMNAAINIWREYDARLSASYARNHASETGNETECNIALSNPGKVYRCGTHYPKIYTIIEKKS